MEVLEVKNLCKTYPAFKLDNVSFTLEPGKITGFIGRNGAGKSTTLKSLFNFVHPDNGEIKFFGETFDTNEFEIKQRVGFVSGGIDYYNKKKIKKITRITKSFYNNWNDQAYSTYIKMFAINEEKTPSELSAGMKVKYALALALSQGAELLILDEPTSGLDPVSRDDLLDVFMDLCDKGITILFSTHITSDLDKCADDIIYIQNGKILDAGGLDEFVQSYRVLHFPVKPDAHEITDKLIGLKRSKEGFTALARTCDGEFADVASSNADLEAIMVHMEKEAM